MTSDATTEKKPARRAGTRLTDALALVQAHPDMREKFRTLLFADAPTKDAAGEVAAAEQRHADEMKKVRALRDFAKAIDGLDGLHKVSIRGALDEIKATSAA